MALPHDLMALEEYFDDLLWTGAYLSALKGFTELGRKVLAIRSEVAAAVGIRNERRDAVVIASVAQAIAWDDIQRVLVSFDRQVDAHFDLDRKAYAKVFTQTVPKMLRAPEKNRAKVLKSVVDFAGKVSRQRGKLGDTAKAFKAGWDEYVDAAAKLATARKAYDDSIENVSEKKHRGVVVMREVDGHVRMRRAQDPSQAPKAFRTRHGKITLAQAKKVVARLTKALADASLVVEKLEKEEAKAAEKKAKGKKSNAGGDGTTQEPMRARG